MDNRLKYRLIAVARRIRAMHLGWALAAVWMLAALCGYLLLYSGLPGLGASGQLPWWWLAISLLASAGCWLAMTWSSSNLDDVARRVEQHFPSLRESLVTAVGLRPNSDGAFSYLQQSVIGEAVRHDVAYRWRSIISTPKIACAWLANIPALGCMALVGIGLWRAPTVAPSVTSVAGSLPSASQEPIVQPGHTEVERGSSLIVTARFEGKLPDEVWLVHAPRTSAGTSEGQTRIAMRQSLGDPVFAAYLHDVRSPMEYAIEYDQTLSTSYRVDVFEYPALVRADAVLDYPGYTQLERKTVVDTRRVSAAMGTRLTWQLHLNKPVAQAQLVADGQEPLPLVPSADQENMVETTIELSETTTWELKLVDAHGRKNSVDVSLRAKVLPNQATTIRLTSGGDVQVSPIQEFDVGAKIRDDFAVQAFGVGYQVGGGELVEIESPVPEGLTKEVQIQQMIDFEALGVEANQLVSYYVWAEDQDEQGQVRRVMSDMFFAEVRPFEEIFRQGQQPSQSQQQQQQQQQGNQQTEELLELQRQIVVGSWNVLRQAKGDGLLGRTGPDLALLAESQTQALELLEEKAAEVDVPGAEEIITQIQKSMQDNSQQLTLSATSLAKRDLMGAIGHGQAAYQGLLKLQSREHEVVRSQQSSSSSSQRSRARQSQIDQLELENQENRYENERLAQQQQDQEQSELRQVISRLRELAARQEDLNDQLRELEAALQAAETPEEQEDLQRQLERLREQQQQMLQDSDELQERMQNQSSEAMQDATQQLEQARENLQQSSQALRQGNTSQALSAGTRAEEELKQLQDEVRRQAANQFAETMQDMRSQASELEQSQDDIVEQMSRSRREPSAGLRASDEEQAVDERLRQQQQRLEQLLDKMQQTVEQAEDAEPLLAQKLYDSYRRTQQQKALERLEVTEQLLRRNLSPQARELAGQSIEDLSMLREDIDEAAEAVLGSEIDSLRLALNQLQRLTDELDREISESTGRPRPGQTAESPSSTNPQESTSAASPADDGQKDEAQSTSSTNNEPGTERTSSPSRAPGDQREATPTSAEGRPDGQTSPNDQRSASDQADSPPSEPSPSQSGSQPGGQSPSSNPPQSSSPADERSPAAPQGDPAAPSPQNNGQPGGSNPRPQPGLRNAPQDGQPSGTWTAGGPNYSGGNPRPLTGEAFREWSDRLRDVEELVTDPELRWQATQIRQAARQIRSEVKKHASDPRWAEVEDLVATPLRELQRSVGEELIRRAADRTEIVPIDRDPVPSEFDRQVRQYYENLGSELQ